MPSMNGKDLVQGKKYAVRLRAQDHDGSIEKVVFVGVLRSQQAKVRWVDGVDSGREGWIRTQQLLCPWGERRAFLRDEESAAALAAEYRRDRDPVVEDAIDHVMTSSGEVGGYIRAWREEPAVIQRMWSRAKLKGEPLDQPGAFADRHGRWHLSWRSAQLWSQAFAAQEPETVNLYLDHIERELLAEGHVPGEAWKHDYLRTSRPAISLARDWTRANVHDHLQREVQRLGTIVSRAVSYLHETGNHHHARRLEDEYKGR